MNLTKKEVEYYHKQHHVSATRHKLAKEWLAMRAGLEEAQSLVTKLREIEADPGYKSVWGLFDIHGGKYDGPNYKAELESLEKGLKELLGEADEGTG